MSRQCPSIWDPMADGGAAVTYSQSLERGLAILSAFRSGRPLLGVSELGRYIGLSRSTTHRYVATLAAIVYVERCRTARAGQREIDLNLHVGSRLPAYCTSLGKVLLAYLPAAEQAVAVAASELTRRGPNTLTSRTA